MKHVSMMQQYVEPLYLQRHRARTDKWIQLAAARAQIEVQLASARFMQSIKEREILRERSKEQELRGGRAGS